MPSMCMIRHCVLLLLVWPCLAWGDTLVLDDGEAFTGQVLRISQDALVFRPTLAGQMMVRTESIDALDTTQNFVVSLADSTILYGRLRLKDDTLAVLPLDGSKPVSIAFGDIDQALAIPTAPQDDRKGMAAWRSSVESGILARFGDQALVDAVLRVESERIGARIALRGELTTGLDVDGGQLRYLDGRFVLHDADHGAGPYGAVEVSRDTHNALDWRTDLSLGLRRAWVQGGDSLEFYLGVGYDWALWDDRHTANWPPASPHRRDETLNLRLGLRYKALLREKTQFIGRLFLLPEIGQWGEIRADSAAEFRYPISDSLHLRLELRLDYNSQKPFRDVSPLEGGVGAGVGVSF